MIRPWALTVCFVCKDVVLSFRFFRPEINERDKNAFRILKTFLDSQRTEWIPIGTVKHLWMFPIKSCKRKEVFSLHCGPMGVSFGEYRDREFLVINGTSGKFLTARAHPKMILIESEIVDGVLSVSTPNGRSVRVVLADVIAKRDVKRGILHAKLEADGVDCGDEVAELITTFLEEPDTRLIYYRPDLFNGRPCKTEQEWWNNPVPKRSDTVMYVDLAPYMITTEGSLKALNQQLERPCTSLNFRGNIVVDQCAAWDEDKWAEIRIGDAHLECFKPCTRCVLTTVDPETGVKDPDMQPLKKLREFRLAPEGKLRDAHGQSPIFGVNAGLVKPGYIHVGQTVYAKYKPSVF
ncbi:hypothetical protein PRIPAC_77363 [Pristionchus pacificus]|uniref:MOSC domain-containing protein n=1 Tax=Pristionchus pacificus TaxID=54126 RepID=A0A2A6CBI4_PRIPA|nr:hypothetical protein PRIPAC_77363 [Pristionchus pacificus]|eukprot:PDM75582.1 hypothetical protein PRIPAC_42759 [Pristionchus pacificus]